MAPYSLYNHSINSNHNCNATG